MNLPLRTEAQVREHMRELVPDGREFRIGRIPVGAWLIQPISTEEDRATGRTVGMSSLVANAETGVVLQYPSWSAGMIIEDYTEAVTSGRTPQARQIYPRQTRVELLRIQETPDRVDYRVNVRSEVKPPEQFTMVIDKQTRLPQPTTTDAMVAAAWASWYQEQDGTWPEMGTAQY